MKEAFSCFIDLEKAFDSISRMVIWNTFEKKGVPASLMKRIKSCFMKCKNNVYSTSLEFTASSETG